MRFRLFLALTSATLLSASFAIQACGGDTDSGTTPAPDSSTADTFTPTHDAATDAADTAPPGCDPNKDYLGTIPDASIADGASSTGVCVACVESKCKSDVTACGADCNCQSIASGLLSCYAMTQDALGCGSALLTVPATTRTLGLNLFSCVESDCPTECATASLLDAGDGGD